MLIATTLLAIATALVLFYHFQRLRKFKWLNQFDGPSPTLPFVGNSLQFIGHRSRMAEIFRSNLKNYGPTYKFWQMQRPTFVTADHKLVKMVLNSNKNLQKHFMYTYSVKIVMGNGLITSDVDQWKVDRKYLNPYFSLDLFGSSFKLCVDNWSALQNAIDASGNNPVNCHKNFTKYFIAIILKSFSSNPNLLSDKSLEEIEKHFTATLNIVNVRIMKPWTKIPLYWKLSGYEKKLKTLQQDLRNTFSKIADDSYRKKVNLVVSTEFENKATDLLSEKNSGLISCKTFENLFADKNKSWEWKYDQTVTIIAGAVDTVSITATMTLFFLALNPECQKTAHDEIDSLYSEKTNEAVQFRDTSKMKYLRMCIKEAMRLHPPVPVFGRTTTEDILMDDGRKIPEGTSIMIPLQGLHLNPHYFPHPHRFDPERFNETNSTSIIPYTYLPFSAGPRNCIGQKYAESVLPAVLAQVLRNYSVTTLQKAEDITLLYEVAGTPYPEVQLIFNRRS